MEEEQEFQALYGPWAPMPPADVARLLSGCGWRWWIAGGWALEAAGAPPRSHGDTDVAVLRRDLAGVRSWLKGFHLWEAHSGSLRPLIAGEEMAPDRQQLWVRRDAYNPWVLDIVFSPADGDEWVYKRDESIRLGLDDVGHVIDGVPYFKPELVLLFKAKQRRPKDEADFAAVAPRLDARGRRFLLDGIRTTEPDSPWITELEAL